MENRIDHEIGRVNVVDNDDPGTGNWEAKYTIAESDQFSNFAIETDPLTNEGILTVVKVSTSKPWRGLRVGVYSGWEDKENAEIGRASCRERV